MPEATSPADIIRIEAAALEAVATRLDAPDGLERRAFERAAALVAGAVREGRHTVVCGVGKSGLIARKIAATLVSTGTPAHFLHPAEALHGDLGLVRNGDVVLLLSYSGETEEILRLLPALRHVGAVLVSVCGCATSTLAQASTVTLDVSIDREACGLRLAPSASTTAMLALGDALALHVSAQLGFRAQDFAELHPGGQLGRRLATVGRLMHAGTALPTVDATADMPAIIHEMSARRLGMTVVQRDGRLLGVISDGDLRRLFERNGPHAFHKRAADIMNPRPRTVGPGLFAADALLAMEQAKITALVVTGDGTADTAVLGIVHLHDLWEVAPEGRRGPQASP